MAVAAVSTHPKLKTANLGFPRMGRQRELKFALEAFWSGKGTEADDRVRARAGGDEPAAAVDGVIGIADVFSLALQSIVPIPSAY